MGLEVHPNGEGADDDLGGECRQSQAGQPAEGAGAARGSPARAGGGNGAPRRINQQGAQNCGGVAVEHMDGGQVVHGESLPLAQGPGDAGAGGVHSGYQGAGDDDGIDAQGAG